MFGFSQTQDFDQEQGYITCCHLRDAATELGVDVTCALGLSADMEVEQLATIKTALEQAIDAALAARSDRHVCHIGPYAAGICTICGGLQP